MQPFQFFQAIRLQRHSFKALDTKGFTLRGLDLEASVEARRLATSPTYVCLYVGLYVDMYVGI